MSVQPNQICAANPAVFARITVCTDSRALNELCHRPVTVPDVNVTKKLIVLDRD